MLTAENCLRSRAFAFSTIYEHPPLPYPAFAATTAAIRPEIPATVATLCKNESNCTIFLKNGDWFTTWSQGSFEHALDERIVFSVSRDSGRTWTPPETIIRSSAEERIAYGVPFVVPGSGRIYLFFHAGRQGEWDSPFYDSGNFYFMYSDDDGASWSGRYILRLPDRDISVFPSVLHAWLNHPPITLGDGSILLPFSAWRRDGLYRRAWMLSPAECNVIRLENILEESDPEKLRFGISPKGGRGIRAEAIAHKDNPAIAQLCHMFNGVPEDIAGNFQEMTLASLPDGRVVGVGRTFLGSPGFTVTRDFGKSWSSVEPLRYASHGAPIAHPMTMCPLTQLDDGRVILLFTNNDGSGRGAQHVWDGQGRTRNPQWFVVGRQIPGQEENAGLVFGQPQVLAEVDDSKETNLKTGISMPQLFQRDGRFFVAYNINKEHLLLDEIPAGVIDAMTP